MTPGTTAGVITGVGETSAIGGGRYVLEILNCSRLAFESTGALANLHGNLA